MFCFVDLYSFFTRGDSRREIFTTVPDRYKAERLLPSLPLVFFLKRSPSKPWVSACQSRSGCDSQAGRPPRGSGCHRVRYTALEERGCGVAAGPCRRRQMAHACKQIKRGWDTPLDPGTDFWFDFSLGANGRRPGACRWACACVCVCV